MERVDIDPHNPIHYDVSRGHYVGIWRRVRCMDCGHKWTPANFMRPGKCPNKKPRDGRTSNRVVCASKNLGRVIHE